MAGYISINGLDPQMGLSENRLFHTMTLSHVEIGDQPPSSGP